MRIFNCFGSNDLKYCDYKNRNKENQSSEKPLEII